MIEKLLQKNIHLSYRLLGHLGSCETNPYRQELQWFLLAQTDKLRGRKVLDVGAGSWNWTKETFSPICQVTSFDNVAHENIDVVGDLYHLHESFSGEPDFDVVIATDVFEHVARLPEALVQVGTVLKPGGWLIASTPFKKNLHGEEYGDFWRITRQGWQHLLAQAGFAEPHISWLGEDRFPLAYFLTAQKK